MKRADYVRTVAFALYLSGALAVGAALFARMVMSMLGFDLLMKMVG
jgi:hypothetical protein